MANLAHESGLMAYASMQKLVEQTEQGSGEILSAVEGRGVEVRLESAQRIHKDAIDSVLVTIAEQGPCLCCPLCGDLEGRLVIWPPASESANPWAPKHQLVAEAISHALLKALQELTGIPLNGGDLRLKHEMCALPEDWGGEAEAWVWNGWIGASRERASLKIALVAPSPDLLALFTSLCLEDAA